jgi:hypothetical protein
MIFYRVFSLSYPIPRFLLMSLSGNNSGVLGMKTFLFWGIATLLVAGQSSAAVDFNINYVPLSSQMAYHGINALEIAIMNIDSKYVPFLNNLSPEIVSNTQSGTYFSVYGQPLAARIAIVDPHDRTKIVDNIIVFNPTVRGRSDAPANYTMQLRHALLQIFFGPIKEGHYEANREYRFTTAQGDLLTLAFVMEFYKLKGFQTVELMPIGSQSIRTIRATNYDSSRFQKGVPSFDFTETASLRLGDEIIRREVNEAGGETTGLHQEVADALNTCRLVFSK